MRSLLLTFVAFTIPFSSFAQETTQSLNLQKDTIAIRFAETITTEELREHLHIVASEEFEGRETGTVGQKKAAEYLATELLNLGWQPGDGDDFFQEFELIKPKWDGTITVNGTTYAFLTDFYASFQNPKPMNAEIEEIIFAGFGIEDDRYNDYDGDEEISGNPVLFYQGEPKAADETYLLSGTFQPSDWGTDRLRKIRIAESKGASAIFVVDPNLKRNVAYAEHYFTGSLQFPGEEDKPVQGTPVFYISTQMAENILPKKVQKQWQKKGDKPIGADDVDVDMRVNFSNQPEVVETENVLAFLEGSDPDLKDEVLVLSAHYDHIGITDGQINYGADDDGSGTVAILEIAEALAEAKKAGHGPKRSVLIAYMTAEEKGLFGSEYYSENPVIPIENTITNLNIDMIGRVDEEHEEDTSYLYIIGSDFLSDDLHEANEWAGQTYSNLKMDYKYNTLQDPNRFYFRSDHYNFARKGVPAIFYFSGVHEDYHKPTDTVDKIMYELLKERARHIFHTTWTILNMEDRPQLNEGISE